MVELVKFEREVNSIKPGG